MENFKISVENHLLLVLVFCAKVVQNLDPKILPDKTIISTLDVPSERYSHQVQKSTRVVLPNTQTGIDRIMVFGALVHMAKVVSRKV